MKKFYFLLLIPFCCLVTSCLSGLKDELTLLKGGVLLNPATNFYKQKVADFWMGRHEVTQKEWIAIMGSNPSHFKGENLPVEMVCWYDCIEYCNRRSQKEGLTMVYNIDKDHRDTANTNPFDSLKWTIKVNLGANGYRLPTEVEWEYAASGGQSTRNFIYSGGNDVDEVAWYWQNSGDRYLNGVWQWTTVQENNDRTHPVCSKPANELGLYDLSGNVREWCWDIHHSNGQGDLQGRIWKGGGWMGGDFCCASSFHASHEATGKGPDEGFRLCRNK